MALLKTMSGHFVTGSRLGFVRSLSRKRILVRSASLLDSSYCSGFDYESDFESMVPAKRRLVQVGEGLMCTDEKSVLESLPQELLIKIICGVNHDDLKQLVHVSKSINEAAKIAKELHFAFATPSKVPAFRSPISPGNTSEEDDEKAPNAPLRKGGRRRFTEEKRDELADVAVALFGSDSEDSDEERWPRRKLFFKD